MYITTKHLTAQEMVDRGISRYFYISPAITVALCLTVAVVIGALSLTLSTDKPNLVQVEIPE